jgi:hypothetical protein
MNDRSGLALGSELVCFQVDFSRTEFLHSNPDHLQQRTLQSLAHSLGLEYEYCLRTRQARITRSDVAMSDRVEISGFSFDHPSTTNGVTTDVTTSRPTINENAFVTANLEPMAPNTNELVTFDPLDLSTFGNVDFNLEEFDPSFNFREPQADRQARASFQRLESSAIPMDISNGLDFLGQWDIPSGLSQSSTDFVPIVPIVPRDEHLGGGPNTIQKSQDPSGIDQFTGVGEKNNRGSSSIKTNHDNRSTPAIHDHKPYSAPSSLKCGYEEVSDGFSEASIYHFWPASSRPGSMSGSRVGSSGSSIGSANSSRSYVRGRPGRVLSFARRTPSSHGRNGSRGFQEIVFDSSQSRPTSTTSTSSLRRKPLDSIARAAAKAVKAISACWRCKFLRKQVKQELFNSSLY